MQYKIQHLKLGGVLDQGIAIIKNNFLLLFGIVFCISVPIQLLQGFLQVSALGIAPGASQFSEEPVMAEPNVGLMIAFGIVSFISLVIAYPWANAAVIHVVARAYLGKDTSLGEAIKLGLVTLPGLIWTGILYGVVVMGGMILLIVPGIIFLIWFCLYQHVVVIERTTGFAALKRSKAILSTNYLTLIAMFLVMWVISAGLGFVAALIPEATVQTIVTAVVQGIATVFVTACFVVFYFSCRCKNENFDLQFLAESVGIQAESEVLGEQKFDIPEE